MERTEQSIIEPDRQRRRSLAEILKLKLGSQPWFASVTATLAVLAGLWGSVYTAEIKNYLGFSLSAGIAPWAVPIPVIVFWTIVSAFAYCFKLGYWAQSQQLSESLNHLERIATTMPSSSFLVMFESYFTTAYKGISTDDGAQFSLEQVHERLQKVLGGIASLTQTYVDPPRNIQFTAVLMWYRPRDAIDAAELDLIRARLRFAVRGVDLRHYAGFLVLVPDMVFSVESAGDKTVKRSAAPSIVLPIEPLRSKSVWPGQIPGAAEAWEDQEGWAYYPSVEELLSYAKEKSGVGKQVLEELEQYFTGEGQDVKSFLSVRIDRLTQAEGVGVLNLHSNEEDFFQGRNMETFVPLVRLFALVLADLMNGLKDPRPVLYKDLTAPKEQT